MTAIKKNKIIQITSILILLLLIIIYYHKDQSITGKVINCDLSSTGPLGFIDDEITTSYTQEYLNECCSSQGCEGNGQCYSFSNLPSYYWLSTEEYEWLGVNPSENKGLQLSSTCSYNCDDQIITKPGNSVHCNPSESTASTSNALSNHPNENIQNIIENSNGDPIQILAELAEQKESPQCSDGKDNDNDGKVDEDDPGCYDLNGNNYNKNDNDEKDGTWEPIGANCDLDNKRNVEEFGKCCYTIHQNVDEPGPKEYACGCYDCPEDSQCPSSDTKTERDRYPSQKCIPKLSTLPPNFNICPPEYDRRFTDFCGVRDSNNRITTFYDCCNPAVEECKLESGYGYCKPLPPLLPNPTQPQTINPNDYKCPKFGQHMCQVNNELWCCPPGGLGSLGPGYSYQLCPGQSVGGICSNEKAPTGLGTIGKCYLKQCGRSSQSINGDKAIKK